ncbi:ankyrin repeat and LEM domain-containing protein 1 isoform X1 [Synchiropus splendidus]|uniref:ankyrin repeat and LEM domain-containing protein 1 isoform X1 n=1 Tax=Synchiropus splendidus TaxID=270530 RepID=UPI00237DF23C|nr:ankyrin repeat and LEM domain-containing protein 1 isoform X1 [Synchiropus splendidus]XP_053707836.1 ankyrin repeat and LEM domain-containing protein 1 isoform X1 [Synchiropus splendidus]
MDRKTRRLASELCKAVNDEEPRSVQLLLSRGASPDLVGSQGVAAIHLAVGKETEKNTQCLKMLLRHGANPNIRSAEGLTPLHVAAVWGCYQNLKLLLMNGGNPNLKDYEGNTPTDLAKQQENRKCAHLLQEHLMMPVETEDDALPQFEYSMLSDQTDVSSCPQSDCSFASSLMSDFGEAALSSTRRSSFFNLSNINTRQSFRGMSSTRLSDMNSEQLPRQSWSRSALWPSEGTSLLSSTRMSALPPLTEPLSHNNRVSPSRRDTLPAFTCRPVSRKSVSFRDVDDYFPVFSPESPKQRQSVDNNISFDLSEYPGFLDSERLTTVLHKHQGVDVTSPDHAYVFWRESSEEEMEKTVISLCKDSVDCEDERIRESERSPAAHPAGGSSSSGTNGSNYSSCESDHYTSALELPLHTRPTLLSEKPDHVVVTVELDVVDPAGPDTEAKVLVKDNEKDSQSVHSHINDDLVDKVHGNEDVNSSENPSELPFTPSPFVTGRTRSRLSRCSIRTGFEMSSLFEESLPTPVRTHRQTPKSQSNFYSSPHAPCCSTNGVSAGSEPSSESFPNTQSSTLQATLSNSQADTIILSQTASDSVESQTVCDTVILEDNLETSTEAYERNLEEVIRAIKGNEVFQGDDFLTDDLTSTDETNIEVGNVPNGNAEVKDEVWLTEDCGSQTESSTSSSSYFSPKRSRGSSDLPSTPGTGCTPRYSMSRLSRHSLPLNPANLSYTPGGRPHIPDVDQPVEYLYTDTEQGHELIETHIPPMSNASFCSNVSSSEDTVVYDWRTMQKEMKEMKENHGPRGEGAPEEGGDPENKSVIAVVKGLTDKELRLRLKELGENPGPINSRTRPTYIKRLCRLLQESDLQPSALDKQPQKGLGYSPELNLAIQTFKIPDCQEDEQALCQQFDQPDQNRKWREGIIKSSFNYLLLDPRVTDNLPFRSRTMTQQECFQTFVRAIFYVGKGKRSRPYSHLYEALEYFRGDKTSKKLCRKVQHILQVWGANQGVISLHCFQNVIPVEAYTREASMVEAIGLKMLTNQKRGDFYGVVSNWQAKRKRQLGVHLLYRAMQIFLAEGERQLRPADIRQ